MTGRLRPPRFWLMLGLALLLGAIALWCLRAARPTATWQWRETWRSTAPGLEWSTLVRPAPGNTVKVTAVRADPARWGLEVADGRRLSPEGATAEQICPDPGAATDAGFFVIATHAPIGWVVADGAGLSAPHREACTFGDWGALVVRGGDCAISLLPAALPDRVDHAVQSAPVLLQHDALPRLSSTRTAPRAAVGLDGAGRIVLAVAEGELTFQEWAVCLRDQLGCRDALNLDGGPSAQLTFRGETTRSTPSSTKVPVLLQLRAR